MELSDSLFRPGILIIGDNLRPLFKTIARDRKIVMTDLQINRSVNYAHIDLIVPMIDRNINDSLLHGISYFKD